MRVTVARKFHFNAAHRLHNPAWSAEKNAGVFGKCNNPSYHGHNYEGIVKVTGEVDPETGYVMDLKELAELSDRLIAERFDHKNLNLDTEEFRSLNPTAENIAIVVWNLLRKEINPDLKLSVTLYETPRNFVEYAGDE
jgi:6-pyruvoyltetrahydropterin/6-carboxytetrahydropterin synthase